MRERRWLSILISAALFACGGGQPEDDFGDDDLADTTGGEDDMGEPGDSTEGHQSARELLGITGPAAPWAEMSHDDRQMDMIGRFHPIFREYFVEYDAERYAEFGCADCHGSDMGETQFAMPSAHLPPVGSPGTPEYAAMHEAHPETMRFMEEEVTPAMRTMLGIPEFGCNGCHPAPGG